MTRLGPVDHPSFSVVHSAGSGQHQFGLGDEGSVAYGGEEGEEEGRRRDSVGYEASHSFSRASNLAVVSLCTSGE